MYIKNKNLLKEYFLSSINKKKENIYDKINDLKNKLNNINNSKNENILTVEEEKFLLDLLLLLKTSLFYDLILEKYLYEYFLKDIEIIKEINKTLEKYNKNGEDTEEADDNEEELDDNEDMEETNDNEEEYEKNRKIILNKEEKKEIKKLRKKYNLYFLMSYSEKEKKIKRISYKTKIKMLEKDLKKIEEGRNILLNYLENNKEITKEEYINLLRNKLSKGVIKLNPSIKYFKLLIKKLEKNEENNKYIDKRYLNVIKWKLSMLKEILDLLVLFNEKLVIKYVRMYKTKVPNNLDFNDLKHEGILGLINAIYKFNPNTNLKLSTYVTWWIKQKIIFTINQYKNLIKIPLYYAKQFSEFENYKEKLELIENTNETYLDEEIAKMMNISPKKLKATKKFILHTNEISINETINNNNNDSNYTYEDKISIEKFEDIYDKIEKEEIINIILDAIENKNILTPTEKYIIKNRFESFNDKNMTETFKSIGTKLNLTKERIRQLENSAIKKIKIYLEDYLGFEENFNDEKE